MAEKLSEARILSHRELEVYKMAFETAVNIFELSNGFPKEEKYSLTDQIRRSSRSVCANIAEAFLKRKYPAAFVSKLSDALSEAGETQVWLEFAVDCCYLHPEDANKHARTYGFIIGKLVNMMQHPEHWRV